MRHTLGQSEIENLDDASVDHEQIGRLDVAMQDAVTMRSVEGVGNLNADVDQLGNFEWTPVILSRSVWPFNNSMTMKGWPSYSPTS